MSESAATSPEALVRNSERLPATKKSAKLHFGENIIEQADVQTVTEPPLQQVLRGPQPSCKKKSSRRTSKRSSMQGPRLSASHIEQAAGDVSDLSASLLLACLFCHFSDCLLLIPGTCCSSLRCLCSFSCLPDLYDICCCAPSCCNNLDCELLDLCHHTNKCARCLLAGLFCELSILCSSLLGCVSCGLCSEGILCECLPPDGLCCSRLLPCDPGCTILDEGCRSSDCLELCQECCSLCFPS